VRSEDTPDARAPETGHGEYAPPPDAERPLADVLQARVRQQAAVAALGVRALSGVDLPALMQDAVETVARTLETELCKVLELLPDGRELKLVAGVGWRPGLVGNATVGTGLDSQAGYTLQSNEPVIVEDLRAEPRFRGPALLRDHGVVSGMSCIIHGAGGRPWGVLGTHTPRRVRFTRDDVHFLQAVANVLATAIQRKLGEEALERARAAAEAANAAKAQFLTVMSHELRTPLNAIGGYAELLEMGVHGPVTAQQAEDLRRIQKNQRHLLGLINDILNYARLEAGRVELDLADVRVDEFLTGVDALVAPQLRAKGLAFDVRARNPDLVLHTDPEKLRQVVLNLLSNAAKFTPAGGRVTLESEALTDVVAIRVRDTGRGIPADQLERIFEPFVQVDRSLTREHDGTGLGLAISRDLARGMGGDLTAESAAGTGSVFTLTLPRA
jgi:signal transduction histidine kinase